MLLLLKSTTQYLLGTQVLLRSSLLVLTLLGAGCSGGSASRGDFLRYTLQRRDGSIDRITLIPEGGARIDVERGPDKYRVLIPASASEIQHILSTLSTVDQSVLADRVHSRLASWQFRQDQEYFTCRRNGQYRTFALPVGQRSLSFLVDGLVREIEVVSHIELVRATLAYDIANIELSGGDRTAASEDFDAAVQSYNSWYSIIAGRYMLGDDLRLVNIKCGYFVIRVTPRVSESWVPPLVTPKSKGDSSILNPVKATADEIMRYISVNRRGNIRTIEFPDAGWSDYLATSDTKGKLNPSDTDKLLGL